MDQCKKWSRVQRGKKRGKKRKGKKKKKKKKSKKVGMFGSFYDQMRRDKSA
jgi:hypothetical protein